jgi:acyl carrier protein phosphodiesterase
LNFFFHAAIARTLTSDALKALGSMLPDFAAICGGTLANSPDPRVQAGIDMHYACDKAFHDAPLFLEQCEIAANELQRAGVRRSTALAVSHVGIELMLDGMLCSDPNLNTYRSALDAAVDEQPILRWYREPTRCSLADVYTELRASSIPLAYQDTSFVASMLVRILASEPRLAVETRVERLVEGWVRDSYLDVMEFGPEIVSEVADRMQEPLINHTIDHLNHLVVSP